MKLMTKEIERKLPALGSQESKPASEVPVVFKLFNPYGSGTWYIIEGDREGDEDGNDCGDWLFFGLCVIQEAELGYVALSDLTSLKKFGRPQIERDLHFGPATLADVMKAEGI